MQNGKACRPDSGRTARRVDTTLLTHRVTRHTDPSETAHSTAVNLQSPLRQRAPRRVALSSGAEQCGLINQTGVRSCSSLSDV